MPFVIIETAGTYTAFDRTYQLGATEVDENDPIVEYLRDGNGPDFVDIRDDRTVQHDPTPTAPEPKEQELLVPFQGRDEQYYFVTQALDGPTEQHGPYDSAEDAQAAIAALEEEADKVPLSEDIPRTAVGDIPAPAAGEDGMTTEDLKPTKGETVECRSPDCDREFKNTGARTNHERAKHPDLFNKAD